MAKYLFSASYTNEGSKGLIKEGGSSRKNKLNPWLISWEER